MGARPGILDPRAFAAIRTLDGSRPRPSVANGWRRRARSPGDLLRLGAHTEIRILKIADFVELIRETPA